MTGQSIRRPTDNEFAPYYATYVSLVPDGDLLAYLAKQGEETQKLLRGIGETKSQHRYAPDKWSIREVVSHLADAERVFTYRALRFARSDPAELPGFDQELWAKTTNAHSLTLALLLDDFQALRASTITLFRQFSDGDWDRTGVASKNKVSVRALAYITAGHETHHVKILKERYL